MSSTSCKPFGNTWERIFGIQSQEPSHNTLKAHTIEEQTENLSAEPRPDEATDQALPSRATVPDKALASRIYKEFSKLKITQKNKTKKTHPETGQENRHFTDEAVGTVSQCSELGSNPQSWGPTSGPSGTGRVKPLGALAAPPLGAARIVPTPARQGDPDLIPTVAGNRPGAAALDHSSAASRKTKHTATPLTRDITSEHSSLKTVNVRSQENLYVRVASSPQGSQGNMLCGKRQSQEIPHVGFPLHNTPEMTESQNPRAERVARWGGGRQV